MIGGFFVCAAVLVVFVCLWRWGLLDLFACAALVCLGFYGRWSFLELAFWPFLELAFWPFLELAFWPFLELAFWPFLELLLVY
ncbi:hypothetical protein PQR75_00485 [Paraburkholderia fungorum]|uniref:hypothetical protein n=2 Tax=Paraburkholderia fungorum TaxID=134537 RepID=UPI0038BB8747